MLENGKRRPERKRTHHVVAGDLYHPDCPICRAHPLGPENVMWEMPGLYIVSSEPLQPKEGCECPLCTEFRVDPENN